MFENYKTVIISNYILDKDKKKLKGIQNGIIVDETTVERALAAAYVSYLYTQDVPLGQNEAENLIDRIAKSLRNFKNKETNKVNHN